MAAAKGNTYAQKHSKKAVLAILDDAKKGMQAYSSSKVKSKSITIDTDTIEHEGYSCIERAMTSNGLYADKLVEWAKTWAKDEEVSMAIKEVRKTAHNMIITNTLEGNYPTAVGIFLMKSVLGMVEKGVADQNEAMRDVPLVKVVSIKADGTRVER